MSNQNNYKTFIPSVDSQYVKYTVSRIVSSPNNNLIETELPAVVPDNFVLDVSLYSLADNSLIYSAIFPFNSSALEVKNFIYPDGSVRRMLFINFFKLGDLIDVDGIYEMVINFFEYDFGGPSVYSLQVTEISPSRREVQLQLSPIHRTPESASKLVDYASPSINSQWAVKSLAYICNQTQSLDENIPTDKGKLTFEKIQSFLPTAQRNKLNNINTPGVFTSSIKHTTQLILNQVYRDARSKIELQIGSERKKQFSETELTNILSSSISYVISRYEVQNDYFKVV